ncbi:amidase signature domain-containing protein [Collybia nuda]|uniref:Glutamyl-tRNA(Gln) amidotransferase subunit A, mitochondrial n=1 Tax=Collybia nuda TaxID=64659 RepID=A0A9P5YEH9_9AGAR|nr:amidase signature domain-containing protein [Collybia nuda]
MRVTRTWAKIQRNAPLHRKLSTESHQCRRVIAERNATVNAFVYTAEAVPTTNTAAPALPLSGRPIAIKDNICTKDMPTTCSSNMLKEFKPPYDATVVRLLRIAGADIIGKTNCDEFGMGSMNIHSVHGPVINPCHSTRSSPNSPRSAGGSSGGSAAAVGAGMCNAALATDTGGSTRLPASYCGVVGLKPSYGLISRWGVVSFADSLDCVGVMAANVADTRRVFDVLNVHDQKDPTASSPESRQEASKMNTARRRKWDIATGSRPSLNGLRIGIPQEYFPLELSPTILQPIRRTIASLRSLGATIVPVSLPSTSYALSAYYVLASAEASSNMARYDGVQYGLHVRPPPGADLTKTSDLYARSRSAGFGPEVQKRILLGTYALTADAFDNYFLQAQRVRQLVKDDFDRIFHLPDVTHVPASNVREDGVDILVHPSAIRTAPALSEQSGLDAYVQDVLTVPASLAGLPALSVPVPKALRVEETEEDDWPVGVSVVGQWGCDETVLRVGEVIEGLGEDVH